MKPVNTIQGKAYPFGLKNIDTDVIIAAQWLKTISRAGLGQGAFESIRKGGDSVFDDPAFAGAPILIAGDNFGCGSSREHAAWALADMGIAAVVAPSFSDIFASNAFKNGILTVVLPQGAIDRLMDVAKSDPVHIDLENQSVTTPFQDRFIFEIDPFRKQCLIQGLDEVGLTMAMDDKITTYEKRAAATWPWQAGAVTR